MRQAVHRLTAPLVNWIPDISGQPPRSRAVIGVCASILFHLAILLVIVVLGQVLPERTEMLPPAQNPLEVQLVQRPESERLSVDSPPKLQTKGLLDPRGLQASAEKPKNPHFESDRDMVAGSEAPASGLLPLPSQEGRADRSTNDFADQDVRIGILEPSQPAPPPAPQPPETAAPPASAPSLPPLYDPNPVAKEKLDAAEHAKANDPLPEPARPRATPPPLKTAVVLKEDEVALAKPSADTAPGPITKVIPPAATPTPERPTNQTTPKYTTAALSTPKPLSGPSVSQRFQENLQKTRVEGSISNHGRPGADAVATPLGRYWSQVKMALATSWQPLVKARGDLVTPGSASFTFDIGSSGRVTGVHMEANSSNSTYGNLCEEAIRRAPIPPPPTDLVPSLREGALEYQMTFTLYPY